MRTTQIATDIGREDNACGVCALLSPEGQQQVAAIQKHLSDELGDGIWCMPPTSLHITLCEILQHKPYSEDKETLFQRNQAGYKLALEKALSGVQPIKVVFNRLEVSPQAVIIRGSDDHLLDAIRAQLVDSLPLPAETKRPPTIVHSSIARFAKELDLKKVESVVSQLNIAFTEMINEFQLMHNGWPHMLHYELAARYPLSKKD